MQKKNKLTREARQKRGYGWKNWRKWIKSKAGLLWDKAGIRTSG